MFERFTTEARAVVVQAQHEARTLRARHIRTEHLLLALLSPDAGIASTVLRDAGVEASRVLRAIETTGPPAILGPADAAALRTIGIDVDDVLARIEASLGVDALTPPDTTHRRRLPSWRHRGASGSGRPRGHIPFSRRAKKVLELSLREAVALRHNYIGAEHILFGLIREGDGSAARILTDAGVDLQALRRATLTALADAA